MSKRNEFTFIDTSQEVIDTMRKLARTGLRAGGKVAQEKLKQNTKVRSARLQKSTHFATSTIKGQPRLRVGYLSKHQSRIRNGKAWIANPAWLEFGVSPHSIEAGRLSSRGKTRRLTGKTVLTDGVHDFGEKVSHPGYSGKNTLRNTISENVSEIRKAQEEALSKLSLEIEKAKGYIDKTEDKDDD